MNKEDKLTLVALIDPRNNMIFHVAQTKYGDKLIDCEAWFTDNAAPDKAHFKVNQTYPYTRINPIIRDIVASGELPKAKRIDTRIYNYNKAKALVNGYYNLMDKLLD